MAYVASILKTANGSEIGGESIGTYGDAGDARSAAVAKLDALQAEAEPHASATYAVSRIAPDALIIYGYNGAQNVLRYRADVRSAVVQESAPSVNGRAVVFGAVSWDSGEQFSRETIFSAFYDAGTTWNGFIGCPYLTLDAALKLARYNEAEYEAGATEIERFAWDAEAVAFTVSCDAWDADEEPLTVTAEYLDSDEAESYPLFALGAFSWTWNAVF